AIKLLATPLIMGIGYEFIRLAGKYQNPVTKLLSAPGLLMQRLTTLEPTDDIIEVGIAALKAVTDEECCKAAKAAPKEKKTEEPEEPKEKEETPAENAETPQESIEAPESPQENEAESV
ncbi:MAG TPA: DUF1385 domain-containing protein, partial [Clostridiales bacterium]|nr:DUF1385 domain-containing protein [Clostridiales bacterium]